MDAGGIETMLMNIFRVIDREYIQFDFLVHRENESHYEKEILDLGGRIWRIRPISISGIGTYNRLLKAFFRKHNEYPIVHSHVSAWSSLVLLQAKKAGIPFRIAHSHESHKSIREHHIVRRPIIWYCKRRINEQLTHRFACSVDAGKWLFGNETHFEVIKNGILTDKYIYCKDLESRKRSELDLIGNFVIGHIGNFSRVKNYPFILKVFEAVHSQKEDSVLLLIGKDSNDPTVRMMVDEMGLSGSVIFTGVRSDVNELLQAVDVFLFPSIQEGLPVSLIEAQAAGLPCIVSDTITEEVRVTDLVEFLSLDDPIEYWSRAILKYANGYERKNTSENIRKAGYDVRDTAERLEDFYMSLKRKQH